MMEEEDKIVQKTSRIRLIKDKMAGSMMLTFTLVSVLFPNCIGFMNSWHHSVFSQPIPDRKSTRLNSSH